MASQESPHSKRAVLSRLHTAAEALSGGSCDAWGLPWQDIEPVHLHTLRERLSRTHKPASGRVMLAACRTLICTLEDQGAIPGDRARRLLRVQGPKGQSVAPGRAISRAEESRLLARASVYDAAVLRVLISTGMRVSELCGLDLADSHGDTLTIRHGKGGRERAAYLPPEALAAVRRWLVERGAEPGPLFARRAGRGPTRDVVVAVLNRMCRDAGVPRITPHDCRRTVASRVLDAGVDLGTAKGVTGHQSAEVFLSYDRRGEDRIRAAAARVEALPGGAWE